MKFGFGYSSDSTQELNRKHEKGLDDLHDAVEFVREWALGKGILLNRLSVAYGVGEDYVLELGAADEGLANFFRNAREFWNLVSRALGAGVIFDEAETMRRLIVRDEGWAIRIPMGSGSHPQFPPADYWRALANLKQSGLQPARAEEVRSGAKTLPVDIRKKVALAKPRRASGGAA